MDLEREGANTLDRLLYALLGLALGAAAVFYWPQPARPLPTTNIDELTQPRPGLAPGYLTREALVDSVALLPPPAAEGSAIQAADDESRRAAIALRDTARWKLAARDADNKFPNAVDAFACTLGIKISATETPHLNMLLRRSLSDAGLATNKAKDKYSRPRPFVVVDDKNICSPQDEARLRKSGSYPSSHAAIGWAWGLILAELAPDKADALIRRGYDYGQSRVVCGVHWQSDVNAGRLVAAAVVAQLHADPDFQAQFSAARKEVAALRAAPKAAPDCTLEQQAVAR
jgi:acid phosphatase (class A)